MHNCVWMLKDEKKKIHQNITKRCYWSLYIIYNNYNVSHSGWIFVLFIYFAFNPFPWPLSMLCLMNPSSYSLHPFSPISLYLWISICHREKYKSFKPHLTLSLHRASYYEISIDDGPWEKQKSSGLSVCTGTGSKAWYMSVFLVLIATCLYPSDSFNFHAQVL